MVASDASISGKDEMRSSSLEGASRQDRVVGVAGWLSTWVHHVTGLVVECGEELLGDCTLFFFLWTNGLVSG